MDLLVEVLIKGIAIMISILLSKYVGSKILLKYASNGIAEINDPIDEGVIKHSKLWGVFGISLIGFSLISVLSYFLELSSLEDVIVFASLSFCIGLLLLPVSFNYRLDFKDDYIKVRRSFSFKSRRIKFSNLSKDVDSGYLILSNIQNNNSYIINLSNYGAHSLHMKIMKSHNTSGKVSSSFKLSYFHVYLANIISVCLLILVLITLLFSVDTSMLMSRIIMYGFSLFMLLGSCLLQLYVRNTSLVIENDKLVMNNLFNKEKTYEIDQLTYSNRWFGVVVFNEGKKVFKVFGSNTSLVFRIENSIKHR